MPPTPDATTLPAAPDQSAAPQPAQPTAPDLGTAPPNPAPDASSIAPAAPAAGPAQPGVKQRIEQGTTHVLGDIFQTLAGGKKIVYQQTPNGPVKTYQDLKPGEMARGILAAAITGLASGYDPANRGKGPAMSSAFASGFKGEEQAREKQAAGAEQEAQKQFANQNMSDELVLRKQKAAQDQQESIVRMAESTAHTAATVQAAQQGKEIFTENRHQHVLDQINQWNADVSSGYTALKDGIGRDISFATPEEAIQALNKDPRHLLHPGDYDTKIEFNPNTSRYEPVLRPKNYEDKTEMRFVKLDKDGKPEKDSSGKFIPSGEKGPDGQVMSPTPMTGAQYGNYIKERDKARYDSADYEWKKAQTAELVQRQKDDAATKGSDDNYFKAGGNPFGVNVETGLPWMSTTQIGIQQNKAKTLVQLYGSQRELARKDLQNAASPQEQASATAEVEQADADYQNQRRILASFTPVDKSTALANSLIAAHSGDNGLDTKAALKQFEDKQKTYALAGWSSQDLAAAHQKIAAAGAAQNQRETEKKETPSPVAGNPASLGFLRNDAEKAAAIANLAKLQKSGVSESDLIDGINNTKKYEQGDRAFLINQVKGLNDVRPGLTRVRNTKTGQTFNVSNDDTKQWTDQGFEIVGQGAGSSAAIVAPEKETIVK